MVTKGFDEIFRYKPDHQITHTLVGQQADAIFALPDLSQASSQSQKKTGTDDKNITDCRAKEQVRQNNANEILGSDCTQPRTEEEI